MPGSAVREVSKLSPSYVVGDHRLHSVIPMVGDQLEIAPFDPTNSTQIVRP